MFNSPLLFPVKLKDEKILVLDESLLPFREDYIEVESLKQALGVLGSMKTRAFGQVLLFFYSCVFFKEYSPQHLSKEFKKVRPTFAFEFLAELVKKEAQKTKTIPEAVDNFIKRFDSLRRKRAKKLADILPSFPKILTICNVNGELIYLYQELQKMNKSCLFYVSETRPYLQGTRLTFWELRKNNIPVYLICDNQVAQLMKEKKVNCVVTGADRAVIQGDIINKVGTYSLARLAKYFRIPFYALVQYPKDIDIQRIKIEERAPIEVFMFLEGNYSQIDAVYPSFDVVRFDLISKQINILDR